MPESKYSICGGSKTISFTPFLIPFYKNRLWISLIKYHKHTILGGEENGRF